ncbi:MAG: RsmE family RNA methyltransferase [Candidatus Eisenbacteria bacterium]|nr:RsmE family RNA methyltransferase [Candidatus Eisenbacteria bacterium]
MPFAVDDLRWPTFYLPPPWPRVGSGVPLPPEETRHALRALRLSSGARVRLVDGEGRVGQGTLQIVGRGRAQVALEWQVADATQRGRMVLAVPWLRAPARLDWLVEKGTELGVAAFAFYRAARSVKRRVRRPEARMERWRAIARSAMKQSGRAWWPRVDLHSSLGELALEHRDAACLVATPEAPRAFSTRTWLPASDMLLLLVGPEGGLSPEEEALLTARRAGRIGLGPRRLRVETAALALTVLVGEGLACVEEADG